MMRATQLGFILKSVTKHDEYKVSFSRIAIVYFESAKPVLWKEFRQLGVIMKQIYCSSENVKSQI
jgi:hypothetical protein